MPEAPFCVIIVDDDAAVRDALKFVLELEGLTVRLFARSEDLLASQVWPARACLVLDFCMPSLNGTELLGKLRERGIDLPAILISARPSGSLRERGLAAGFIAVLDKPLEDEALLDGIRQAMVALGAPLAACTT